MILGIFCGALSILLSEAGSDSQISPTWLVLLSCWHLALGIPTPPLRLELQASHHVHLVFMWVLGLQTPVLLLALTTKPSSQPLSLSLTRYITNYIFIVKSIMQVVLNIKTK